MTNDWVLTARVRPVRPASGASTYPSFEICAYVVDGRLFSAGFRNTGFCRTDAAYADVLMDGSATDSGVYYEVRMVRDQAASNVLYYLNGFQKAAVSVTEVAASATPEVAFGDASGGERKRHQPLEPRGVRSRVPAAARGD